MIKMKPLEIDKKNYGKEIKSVCIFTNIFTYFFFFETFNKKRNHTFQWCSKFLIGVNIIEFPNSLILVRADSVVTRYD